MLATDLSIIAAIDSEGSFLGAARLLGVSHTTIARKLRRIEEHYGTTLVARASDRAQLTVEGERALSAALRIEEEMMSLERSIIGRDSELSGDIRLTTVDILATHYMDRFVEFRARYPEIALHLSTSPEIERLSRRDADMALRVTNAPDEYLVGRVVDRFSFAPFVAEAHADQPAHKMPWLGYTNGDRNMAKGRWLERHVPRAREQATLPSAMVMMEAVRAGLGAGLLPVEIAREVPGLVQVDIGEPMHVDVWLLVPEELRHTARVRAMFDTFPPPRRQLRARPAPPVLEGV